MVDLTNLEELKKLDPKRVYDSTGMLADQCEQILRDYFNVNFFPQGTENIENVVICGMGGSAYGGHVAVSLFHDTLSVPVVVNSDYHLPGFVNEKSLVLLTSYSGSTEEVLSCAEEAEKRSAMIAGFSSGGKLGDFLKEKYPGFTFESKFNPSGQPRLGTGYMIMSTIAMLKAAKIIAPSDDEVKDAIEELRSAQNDIQRSAQDIAQKLINYLPVIMTAEFLNGNGHILRNQFNETSKVFSAYAAIPELNHHLLEGFKNPDGHKLMALLINSNLYSEKIEKRMMLTEDVIKQNNVPMIKYEAKGSTKIGQMLQVLSLGGYITVYLAFLYGLDPSLIPWVDYFKEKLSQ
jgi:glucose/mannose-6-phosphate isomerase